MSWFKRRKEKQICEHEYRYYGYDLRVLYTEGVPQYHFICTKCEHEITVDALQLSEDLSAEKLRFQKAVACGKDIDGLDNTAYIKFWITATYPPCEEKGGYVDMLRKKYERKGIVDICEINKVWKNVV